MVGKNNRNLRGWFVVMLALLLAIAACSSDDETANDETTAGGDEVVETSAPDEVIELNFWSELTGEPYRGAIDQAVADFNDANPDIVVTHRAIENESFFTVMRTAFTSGEPPEIFQHEANTNLFQFVIPGEVADITDWWDQPGNGDRFTDGSDSAVRYDGKIYGIPYNIHTTNQLYYNNALLNEAGIDIDSLETWDDFLTAFEQLKAAGITPIAFGNSEGWPGSQWFYTFLVREVGAEKVNQLVSRNCGYSWTDDDVVRAAQRYVDLADAGYFSSGMASDGYDPAVATFFSGGAAFFHTGSWFVAELTEAPPELEFGMVTFPLVPGGAGTETEGLVAVLGGYSISRVAGEDPATRDAALRFLDYLSQPESAQEWVSLIGDMLVIKDSLPEEGVSPLMLQILEEQVNNATGTIGFLEHMTPKAVGEEAIWQGSVAVLTGDTTAEEWMAEVEAAAAAEPPAIINPESCGS